jgi:hypothetical protein
VKCSGGPSNRVSKVVRRYMSYEVCCLMVLLVYHIFFYSFGFIFMFCMLLFNCVNYIFLLLCICTLVTHVVFCSIVLFFVLFVCKCVIYYCHRVSTQLPLTNI